MSAAQACTEVTPPAERDAAYAGEPDAARSDGGSGAERDAGDAWDGSPGTQRDAAIDGGEYVDVGPGEQCRAHQDLIEAFVAAHRACESDHDCAIVGDCSHADFRSVARAFAEQAHQLVLADPCAALDGPTYNAVCRAGACERVRSREWCGGAPRFDCPLGTGWYRPGCGTPATLPAEGCYAACRAVGDDRGCAPGFTCQSASIDPCAPPPGSPTQGGCAACGLEATLCLPAPACELGLSIQFDGDPMARIASDESSQLQLWLENRTERTLSVSFDTPCHGPLIEGLGGYDVWQACLAGACPAEPVQTDLTLAPHERLRWRTAVIAPGPSTCDPAGLAPGMYTPSLSLGDVRGAQLCGPTPSTLQVDGPSTR